MPAETPKLPEFKITLRETRKGLQMMERTPRYEVLLNGEPKLPDGRPTAILYFNTRGYRGVLPFWRGGQMDIGEA